MQINTLNNVSNNTVAIIANAKPIPAKPKAAKPKVTSQVIITSQPEIGVISSVLAQPMPSEAVAVRGRGRTISDKQVIARRRVVAFLETHGANFTVKELTKKTKLARSQISNAMRWAETNGLVNRVGYKIEKRAGRKDLIFRPANLAAMTDAERLQYEAL